MWRTCKACTRYGHPSSRGPESTERHHTPQAQRSSFHAFTVACACARPDVATCGARSLHCLPPHINTRNQPHPRGGVNHWTGTGPAPAGPCNSWPLHQLALHQLALQLQRLARPVIYPRPDGSTLGWGTRSSPRIIPPGARIFVVRCGSRPEAGRKQGDTATRNSQPTTSGLLCSVAGSQFRRLEMQRCMPVHG